MKSKWTGNAIKALRARYGLSQEELAALVGSFRQQTISDWEADASPRSRAYTRILDELEIELKKHSRKTAQDKARRLINVN